MKYCSFNGCRRKRAARGWCSRHYDRWRHSGNPEGIRIKRGSTIRWIKSLLTERVSNECIPWPFATNENGYGRIRVNSREFKAHRYIFILKTGSDSPGMECCHNCGNGHLGCVNPSHLEWKTHKENMEDMSTHGRVRGENNAKSILTEKQVLEILNSKKSPTSLAKEYRVSRTTISSIVNGHSWKHVPRPQTI